MGGDRGWGEIGGEGRMEGGGRKEAHEGGRWVGV